MNEQQNPHNPAPSALAAVKETSRLLMDAVREGRSSTWEASAELTAVLGIPLPTGRYRVEIVIRPRA